MVHSRFLRNAAALAVIGVGTAVLFSQTSGSGEGTVQSDIQTYMTARAAAYSSTTSFGFGVFSDIHMSEDAAAILTRAQWAALLTTWKNQGNLFDVIVGDLGFGNLGDRDNVLSGPAAVPGGPPVFYAMGNHEDDPIGKRSWIDALYPGAVRSTSWTGNPSVPAGNMDHVYWSFNVGPTTHFIFLDGDYQTRDTATRQWQTLGPAQVAWLTADLAANTDKNVCVFIHEPIDQQATGIAPHLTLNDKGPLLELLSLHPKKTYVFSGHLHGLGGITKWKGVTSVHVMTGVSPNNGVRVNVTGETFTITGTGTGTITDFDASPMNQTVTIAGSQVQKIAEDGAYSGNTTGPKMFIVSAEGSVTPTSGGLMLRADSLTTYSPRFISEALVKVVPGLHLSYDINLQGVTAGLDAVAVQPYWHLKTGGIPPPVYDQNWIALSRRPRIGMFYPLNDDMPTLGGRATGTWYHRDFDLTPMSGGWVDGIYLTSSFGGANVTAVYVDNIRFTWAPTGTIVPGPRVNVASAANGAVASASSSYNANYPPLGGNDGDRRGSNWGVGGAWNDGTIATFPDWYQVDFAATKTIDEIDVFSIQDTYLAPIDPTPIMNFFSYGLRDFEVQYWNGSTWAPVPGGTVTGNSLVWRKFTFPAVTTSKIRLWITNGLNQYSRLAEIEAYETSGAGGNVSPTVALTGPSSGAVLTVPVSTTISATASDVDGSVTSVAFYANGTLIGTDPTSPYSVTWTGPGSGAYTLTAVATDNLGATSTSASVPVSVTVPPVVSITSPAGGTSVPAGTAVTFSASASDSDGSVTAVSFYANGALLGTDASSPYSITWTPSVAGSYNLTAVATDNVGATTTSSATSLTVVANALPVVTLTSPTSGSSFTAPASMTISASASDADGTVAKVDFYANGALLGSDATSPFSFAWSGVSAGNYSLTAIATDNLGAASTVSGAIPIVVNSVGGRINVALAANGGTALASSAFGAGWGASGTINGDRNGLSWESGGGWNDANKDVYPDWLEVDFSGTKQVDEIDIFTVQNNYSAPSAPTPSMTFTLFGVRDFEVQYWNGSAWTPVPGGTVTGNTLVWRQFVFSAITTSKIRVFVSKGADGYSRLTEVEAYGVPAGNSAPSVSISSPSSGTTFTSPASTTISASASDTDGTVASVAFYANGVLIGTDTTSPFSVPWSSVPAGTYSLTAVATDNVGAATTSSTVSVTVNAPPTVTITSPTAGAAFTAPASTTISANAADSDGSVSSVAFYANGALIGTDTTSPFSVPWSGVSAGSYSLTAVATDNRGATTTSSPVSVTVSVAANVPPTVVLTAPAAGSVFTAPASTTVSANAGDSDGTVASVAFYANGSLIGTDPTSPYSVPWSAIPAGSYTLTAVATDNLGAQTTSVPVNVTVNGAAPRVNVALAANGGVAVSSSTLNANFPASAVTNGDRLGSGFGAGGAWLDATASTFPDWIEVDFNGLKLIDEVDVFGVQDTPQTPITPTVFTLCTYNCLVDFSVQYWTGTTWLTVPGGIVTGNNRVWRTFTFSAISTAKIRILVTRAPGNFSMVTEIEAYGTGGAPAPAEEALDQRIGEATDAAPPPAEEPRPGTSPSEANDSSRRFSSTW